MDLHVGANLQKPLSQLSFQCNLEMHSKYKISKWIMLALAVLSNAFLIFYSCLSGETTSKWNWFVTNLVSKVTNSISEKEVVKIPMTELNTFLSLEESYQYNHIPGYDVDEIPLGSAKQIESSYLPLNTTDNGIQYFTSSDDLIKLNQNKNIVSVVGLKKGEAIVYAKNESSNLISKCNVKVVETIAPVNFVAILSSQTVSIGEQGTIDFDIDGGVLGHDELINSRYYDIRKLSFVSSDSSILHVDSNGVIYPKSTGFAKVTISNGTISQEFDITIQNGEEKMPYTDLKIAGSNVCYDNDMIKDQISHKNHYQLEIKDGDLLLNPEDFIWNSSNELLARVDKHGVLRGFRKTKLEDETVTITAISKLTKQEVTFEVTVKEQLPESLTYSVTCGKNTEWSPSSFTACNGDAILIQTYLSPSVTNKEIIANSSNEKLAQIVQQGDSFLVNIKGDGKCEILFYSQVQPALRCSIELTLLKAGAINQNNISEVGFSLRKILGHALVFGVAQVFTFLALYMFMFNKQWWLYSSVSLGVSTVVATTSEIIERHVPGRSGTFIDILIDLSGALVVFVIVLAVILIKNRSKKNTNKHNK